jgi:putative transcriptional regulator
MSKLGGALIDSPSDDLIYGRGKASAVRLHTVEVPECHQFAAGRTCRGGHLRRPAGFRCRRRKPKTGTPHPNAPAAAYLLAISGLPAHPGAALAQDP